MKKKFVIAGTSNRGLNSYGRHLVPSKEQMDLGENFGYGNDSADNGYYKRQNSVTLLCKSRLNGIFFLLGDIKPVIFKVYFISFLGKPEIGKS